MCARELPADWVAPVSAGLQEAISAAEVAGRAADEAGKRVVALATERTGVERLFGEAVSHADDADETLRVSLQALGEAAGVDLQGRLPDHDALLGPLDTARRAASDALGRHERDHAAHVETLARQEQEARDGWESAQRAAVATGQRAAALTADLQGLDRQLDDTGNRAGAASDALTASFQALGEAAGMALADPLPDRDALLGPFEAAEREASDVLQRHEDEHAALQNESNRLSNEAAAATAAAAGARTLAGMKQAAAATALAQAHEAIRAVPAPFRPSLDLPAEPARLRKVDTDRGRRTDGARQGPRTGARGTSGRTGTTAERALPGA